MQTQNMRDKQLETFAKDVEGWTITKVTHNNADEGMIILFLKKDGVDKTRKVRISATDLGWWHKTDKEKKRRVAS